MSIKKFFDTLLGISEVDCKSNVDGFSIYVAKVLNGTSFRLTVINNGSNKHYPTTNNKPEEIFVDYIEEPLKSAVLVEDYEIDSDFCYVMLNLKYSKDKHDFGFAVSIAARTAPGIAITEA